MKISVIMLTHNRERMVGKAIESILLQTFSDFELILVDNGSVDRSGDVCEQYAQKDNRIQVIHKKEKNIGSGRNVGLKYAKGDYVAFIDDDDWCESDYLEFLYDLVVINQADISICGAYREEEGETSITGIADDVRIMNAEEAVIQLMWRKRYNTGFPTKLISRHLFHQYQFSETSLYDDISLMYKILSDAKRIVYYGIPKYHVQRHEGNNSSATTKYTLITKEYLETYRKAYRDRTQWLCKRFPRQSNYWWYFDNSFLISMVNKIITNQLTDCYQHLKEMKLELFYQARKFMNSPYILDFEKVWMIKYILNSAQIQNKGLSDVYRFGETKDKCDVCKIDK